MDFERARADALKCKTIAEFKKKYKPAWNWSQRNKILDKVQEGLIRVSGTGKFLTDDDIFQKAKNFSNRSDFKNNERVAYDQARKRGIAEEVCKNMDYGAEGSRTIDPYTQEELLEISLGFDYKSDLCQFEGGAYRTILKQPKEFIKKCFAHMKTHTTRFEEFFINSVVAELKKCFPKIEIELEVWISKKERIDSSISYKNKHFYIEFKSEKSKTYWTLKENLSQMKRYEKALKGKECQLVLVSETGKYGTSVQELFEILSSLENF